MPPQAARGIFGGQIQGTLCPDSIKPHSHDAPTFQCGAPCNTLPLPVDFLFAAQVAEDGFHRRKTLTDAPPPGRAIDACFHLLDPALARVTPTEEEGHLAGDRLLGFTQALAAQAAGLAGLFRPWNFITP